VDPERGRWGIDESRGLLAFFSEGWWVGSPLYLLLASADTSLGLDGRGLLILQAVVGALVAGLLYRTALGTLGFLPALTAGLLWAVAEPAVSGGLLFLGELLAGAATLLLVRALLDLAWRREPRRSWRAGAGVGGVGLLHGPAALWLPWIAGWLPWRSRRFRGAGWAVAVGLLLAGWLALALLPILHGALEHRAFTPTFANGPYDLYVGAVDPAGLAAVDEARPVDPVRRFLVARHGSGGAAPDTLHAARVEAPADGTRAVAGPRPPRAWLAEAARLWAARPGVLAQRALQRAAAFLGGAAPGPVPPPQAGFLPLLPLDPLLILAFLGAFALLGSLRVFAPLYAAVGLPLLVAAFTGLTARGQLAALPFLCLFAGYGAARLWMGRRSPVTWVVAPLLLAAGWAFVRAF